MKTRAFLVTLFATCVVRLSAQTYSFSTTNFYGTAGGIAIDAAGQMYATNLYANTVTKVAPDGTATLLAGSSYASGSDDGAGSQARFGGPYGIAADSRGNLYVTDTNYATLRKITPAGIVSTLAGLAGNRGSANGTGSAARFNAPQGIAVDAQDNLYVADTNNSVIRKITPAGVVTTLAGSPGVLGATDGTGSAARFNFPSDLAIDANGNVFVTDTRNHTLRKVTPAGVVTTLAGAAGSSGDFDGSGTAARFSSPQGIAIDRNGALLVNDVGNYTIRKVSPSGQVTTLGGLAGSAGNLNGVGAAARFYGGRGLAADSTGTLFIADSYNIRLGVPSNQLVITVQPQPAAVAAGSNATFTVTATGAGPITYRWQKDGIAVPGATTDRLVIAGVQAANSGSYNVTVTNPVETITSNAAALTVLAALPNDNFGNAQAITSANGSASGHNNGATGEPDEPSHGLTASAKTSVWYNWTAPTSGTVSFNLSTTTANMVVAAYTGTALPTLTRVAQANPYQRLIFPAVAGTVYRLAIGSADVGSRGTFTLTWRMIPNDDFANAQILSGDSGNITIDTNGATSEPGEPALVSTYSSYSNSVWYRWTPTVTGTATISAGALDGTSIVAVYTGSSLDTVSRVAVGGASTVASAIFNVTAGTTYSIAVGGNSSGNPPARLIWSVTSLPVITSSASNAPWIGGSIGTISVTVVSATPVTYQWFKDGNPIAGAQSATLTIQNVQAADAGSYEVAVTNAGGTTRGGASTLGILLPPANDNFAGASGLVGLSGSITGTTVNATGQTGEPIHWNGNGTTSSIWYAWTPTTNGLAVLDTVGSATDTVLAVYTGGALTALTRVTQDDDRAGGRASQVSFAATANTTYSIAVGTGSGGRGVVKLNWQLSPTLAITTAPVSQIVAVGGTATFTVQATGTNVSYQWLRNGTAIPGATNATLSVANIQGGTDANYSVTITNSTGSVTSAPAALSVAAPSITSLTARNQRDSGTYLWSIAGGNGTLVAVGHAGAILSSSDNGKSWVPRNSQTSLWLVGVTYGAGRFVIVGEAGTILTSINGDNWLPAAKPGTSERINNVIYADNTFVAVGEHGVILTSTDAETWTVHPSGVNTWLHGLAYNAKIGQFATCGESGVFLVSADALNWSRLPLEGVGTTHIEAIVAGDSYAEFVAVGHQGLCVSIHQNQLRLKTGETVTTWTSEINPTGTTEAFVGLTSGAGALFATGSSGKVATADDSRGPWFTLPTGTTDILLGATFYQDTLFVVGDHERILQSDILYHSRLVNISTRGKVGTDADVLISGFVVNGTKPKQVLVRAAGPALGLDPFNITGVLARPVLTVLDRDAITLASNTGWSTAANAAAISTAMAKVGAFPFATGSGDSAVLITLSPGQYTAKVAGLNDTTGVAIIEVYDVDDMTNNGSRAINISTRGVTGSGSNVMIAGFVVNGAASRRLLIRGIGPALNRYGVTGTANEPQLSLYNGRGVLTATASAWGLQSNADEIRTAAKAVQAFDLPEGSKDSAMLVTVLPGAWTVQVSNASGASGVALIEVYEVP